ncbi:MAG: bifunctional folylpolyglutamate synthase/dihydrofolate synthase, partial [Alistipes sp.]|nr:bifunctional folylpolyglutamate synthase/dihydrofolate synthase [Alistipes sp.]
MNYAQTIEYLFTTTPSFQQVGADAYKPGLERILSFCHHLGDPQKNYKSIHVAGTNGKGSVSHMLASVLQHSGYRVGLFTSPHLRDFRERMRVDGEMISERRVVDFVARHKDKMRELDLSFFEMTTAMAFDFFSASDVEVAVIETGLGGRLDATNVILPELCVVTNIGLEHTDLLGDTIEKVAAEKAGIIKPSVPIILGEANEQYNHVFEQRAAACGSRVIYAEQELKVVERRRERDSQH